MTVTTGGRRRRTRKTSENLDERINQDILEKILSFLPSSAFFRLRSVCRTWNSVFSSPAFRISCSQIRYRDPWFLMVDRHLRHSVIFDTSAGNWMKLNKPSRFNQPGWIAVASSGGLVCFRRRTSGELMACNPLTGTCREIPPANQAQPQPPVALAMSSSCNYNGYRIVLVSGELSDLRYRVFDSGINQWEDEVVLVRAADSSPETEVYFIDKSGDVVATNIQRNPSKQFSAVISVDKNGEEIMYFVSHVGLIVACNLTLGCFHEYPNLLPLCSEYSIDVVLCGKEMMVVLLSEFLETASLRLWRFCVVEREWRQVAAMAPAMSHEFYGKKTDINCVGCGELILVCLSSMELSRYVMYNVGVDEWVELPGCFVDGKGKDFMAAFSFEPRLEVVV